jgi:hypothetical protein
MRRSMAPSGATPQVRRNSPIPDPSAQSGARTR